MADVVYCDCGSEETPENPKRECSRCGGFVDFMNEIEWSDWVNSLMCSPEFRCIKCWRGESRCTCPEATLL